MQTMSSGQGARGTHDQFPIHVRWRRDLRCGSDQTVVPSMKGPKIAITCVDQEYGARCSQCGLPMVMPFLALPIGLFERGLSCYRRTSGNAPDCSARCRIPYGNQDQHIARGSPRCHVPILGERNPASGKHTWLKLCPTLSRRPALANGVNQESPAARRQSRDRPAPRAAIPTQRDTTGPLASAPVRSACAAAVAHSAGPT